MGISIRRVNGWSVVFGDRHFIFGDPYDAVVTVNLVDRNGRTIEAGTEGEAIAMAARGEPGVGALLRAIADFEKTMGIQLSGWERIEGGISRWVRRRKTMSGTNTKFNHRIATNVFVGAKTDADALAAAENANTTVISRIETDQSLIDLQRALFGGGLALGQKELDAAEAATKAALAASSGQSPTS